MRTKLLSFFFLLSFVVKAQITDLQKISKGKFYSSDVIRDSNNNIKGYFFLFETDKIAKETFELEYVVLDENLTKVTSGFITEMKYESWLVSANKIVINVSLYKNKLLIQFTDHFNMQTVAEYRRFRILDLQNNKLSDPFIFNQGKMLSNPPFDRKIRNYGNVQSEEMMFCNDVGLIVDSRNLDREYENRYLVLYDENNNQVWKTIYENGEDKKRIKSLTYMNSDKDVIVYFNHFNKRAIYVNDYSVLLIDAKTGKIIKEFFFPNVTDFAYKVVNVVIKENEVVIFGNFTAKSDFGFTTDTDNTGLFSYRLDKKTGKSIESKFIYWKNSGSKLAINSSGYIKDEGYIYIHNMLPLSDGRIIVVCEAFLQQPITTNNMYFLELSKDFKLSQVFEVAKFKNKFPKTVAHSTKIKQNGLFDFIDYQNLGDDEFLFFLNDNEKNARNRNKSTLYGIVSYSDNGFKKQTLNLKTETSSISAYPSKKGYITLIESFDDDKKSPEIRLEKINY